MLSNVVETYAFVQVDSLADNRTDLNKSVARPFATRVDLLGKDFAAQAESQAHGRRLPLRKCLSSHAAD